MERHPYTILSHTLVADRTWRMELAAGDPAFVPTGEFVNLALEGFYLRRPLSILDRSASRISLIYKVVGEGTAALSRLREGQVLDVLCGLGRGFDPDTCTRSALLVAGGLGAAPLLPLCKELADRGREIRVILGFNTASEIVLEEEFRALTPDVTLTTVDGSAGLKGFVTDALRERFGCGMADQVGHDVSVIPGLTHGVIPGLTHSVIPGSTHTVIPGSTHSVIPGLTGDLPFDCFYTCGPLIMMQRVCEMLETTPGQACLEERMGCGGGYCAGCSIRTRRGTRRVCKDGPVFDKEDILW